MRIIITGASTLKFHLPAIDFDGHGSTFCHHNLTDEFHHTMMEIPCGLHDISPDQLMETILHFILDELSQGLPISITGPGFIEVSRLAINLCVVDIDAISPIQQN